MEYSNTQYEIHTTCLCPPSFRLRSPLTARTSYVGTCLLLKSFNHPSLPQGSTIAGTTDSPTEVTHSPSPSEGDIQFILNEVKNCNIINIYIFNQFNILIILINRSRTTSRPTSRCAAATSPPPGPGSGPSSETPTTPATHRTWCAIQCCREIHYCDVQTEVLG